MFSSEGLPAWDETFVPVQGLRLPSLSNRRDDLSSNQDAFKVLVLDDLFDVTVQERDFDALFAADAGDKKLQDGLADGTQDQEGDGRSGRWLQVERIS